MKRWKKRLLAAGILLLLLLAASRSYLTPDTIPGVAFWRTAQSHARG